MSRQSYPTPSAPLPAEAEVVVVGAGLSGLSCALLLERRGVDVHLVEASDDVGGRVRTDEVDGFLLDRGFQVLLTAYEEVQAQVDLPRLDLKPFGLGALVWTGERLEKMSDPFRSPAGALAALASNVGTMGDKMKVARLRRRLVSRPAAACFQGPERTTSEELSALGFTDAFVDTFFRPFMGGVFLERDLATSSSLFRYYFRCFSLGEATLPAEGMQRLPELLASPLEERITLGASVRAVTADGVTLDDGSTLAADQVVVAVDSDAAARLLGGEPRASHRAVTSYFATHVRPIRDRLLLLDGEGAGPVNHAAVVSNVSPALAPPGHHLVSVSGVGDAAADPDGFAESARLQLRGWFGAGVERWEHLRTYAIEHAAPSQPPGSIADPKRPAPRRDGIVVAGDHTRFGAIQGALLSGRKAAEAVLKTRAHPAVRSGL